MIAAYKLLWKTLKKQPCKESYLRHCYPASVVFRVLGADGWKKLVTAGGGSLRGLRNGKLERNHLISDFFDLQRKLGRRPKLKEYISKCHTAKVLDVAFGAPGWRNMLREIGPAVLTRGIDAEHLVRDYVSLRQEIGERICQDDFLKHRQHSFKLLKRVFGDGPWTKLCLAAKKYDDFQ